MMHHILPLLGKDKNEQKVNALLPAKAITGN
jgi:hypothetical protein